MKVLAVIAFSGIVAVMVNGSTVTGRVVNEIGTGISGAKVNVADPFVPYEGLVRFVTTNKDGSFEIRSVEPGRYTVYARLPAEGYGDPQYAFFAEGSPALPTVNLSSDTSQVDVTVNLGNPGGILTKSGNQACKNR